MDRVGHGDISNFNNKEKCSKSWQTNHEHQFKSMNSYITSNIGDFCQRHGLIELIDVANPLTVKITSIFTSNKRETEKPLNSSPYDYYAKDGYREASGFIFGIKEDDDGKYILQIATAMHIVFDKDEAWNTFCYLYYDGENSETVQLEGTRNKNLERDINNDWCVFECTIDANTSTMVKKNLEKWQLSKSILKRYAFERNKKVLLISHPHGCYKYLSMGDLTREHMGDLTMEPMDALKMEPMGDLTMEPMGDLKMQKDSFYRYTTPSCKGSSGGYLIVVGRSTTSMFIHSGYFHKDKNKDGYSSGEIELN